MRQFTFFGMILNFILPPVKPKNMLISVKENGTWRNMSVPNPITFSELNERLGEGAMEALA